MTATAATTGSSILSIKALPDGPMPTMDPFLFCVYHKDQYPPGNEKMESLWPGDGSHFDPDAPYRMYHGDMVPGFPQHPHRGFETITATIDGIIDHADSLGNAGRYGNGDLQWMTAGKGCVHSEMFPLIKSKDDNPTRFFQIWLNLPAKNKMADAGFEMFWNHQVPIYKSDDGMAQITVWSGEYFLPADRDSNNAPPPASWAADPDNDVAIFHIILKPGGTLTLPPAHQGSTVNRNLFLVEGKGDGSLQVDGAPLKREKVVLHVKADVPVQLQLDESAEEGAELLLLQGKPIAEPVAKYGPFVMNTEQEIHKAFVDYQSTKFGGWPWPRDDMVFEREKSRFALFITDGEKDESVPPDAACLAD